jgi:hypothetical protein
MFLDPLSFENLEMDPHPKINTNSKHLEKELKYVLKELRAWIPIRNDPRLMQLVAILIFLLKILTQTA